MLQDIGLAKEQVKISSGFRIGVTHDMIKSVVFNIQCMLIVGAINQIECKDYRHCLHYFLSVVYLSS